MEVPVLLVVIHDLLQGLIISDVSANDVLLPLIPGLLTDGPALIIALVILGLRDLGCLCCEIPIYVPHSNLAREAAQEGSIQC